ncbi:unnamed protein product [Schistocephalus solidus]|uniref:peptide-methionine (S)-S-oxide reductase n=1 Tax=Schistocephalus solidus TaxID=70667 RepID=A0A3P7CA07_SCHSO|nr:unnamed protein product [Schistocephalus solidus]
MYFHPCYILPSFSTFAQLRNTLSALTMASTVATHSVLGTPMNPPFPAGHESVMFGMGCFWGAERKFWEIPNIYTTQVFWESHDPTQFNRQGNDVGTQYRSVIFTSTEEQLASSLTSRDAYQSALGHAQPITTEIRMESTFTPAEDYHQQYLNKNPHGYCGLQGTGVTCPKW